MIEELRGALSESELKYNQQREESEKQGPSRLEKIQAEAIAEKDDQLSSLREELTFIKEREAAAELAAVEMKRELDALKQQHSALSADAERKAAEHRVEAEASSARIATLERHVLTH